MAGNAFNTSSLLWVVDSTGALITDAPGMVIPVVEEVVYVPSTVSHNLVFQTGNDEDAIVLKAGASDASPVHLSFVNGRRVPGLQCTTIDGGTAYVYLK